MTGLRKMASSYKSAYSPELPLASTDLQSNITFDESQPHDSCFVKHCNAMSYNEWVMPLSPSSSTTNVGRTMTMQGNYNPDGNLKQKVVDGWSIIQQQEEQCSNVTTGFGETALENLLINSGPMNLGSQAFDGPQEQWLHCQLAAQLHNQQRQLAMFGSSMVFGSSSLNGGFNENSLLNGGFNEGQQIEMSMVNPTLLDSQAATDRKKSDENSIKSSERKQKRMLKNRESAARSRARKQAHIKRLEGRKAQLTKINEQLKKQKVIQLMRIIQKYQTALDENGRAALSTQELQTFCNTFVEAAHQLEKRLAPMSIYTTEQ